MYDRYRFACSIQYGPAESIVSRHEQTRGPLVYSNKGRSYDDDNLTNTARGRVSGSCEWRALAFNEPAHAVRETSERGLVEGRLMAFATVQRERLCDASFMFIR